MTDENEQKHPGYIRLQIDMSYDARSQGCFVKAPGNWAEMDADEQRSYLDMRAEEYLSEQVESHATYYATADDAAEENTGGWGLSFDPDDVEGNEE